MIAPRQRGDVLRSRFEILGVLGEGGMGVVYRAFDRERGQEVALKAMRALSAEALYRFKAEFRVLADLRHPGLVRLGELFGEGDEWFFTMERIQGTDLLEWVRGVGAPASGSTEPDMGNTKPDTVRLDRAPPFSGLVSLDSGELVRGALDEQRLRSALSQLVDAVCALHAAGHVHRDLKPSNVLVTNEGRVTLLDFGLARPFDPGLASVSTDGHAIEGTIAYMAPEQANGGEARAESDWYSVGVVLYEALSGRLPFSGAPLSVLTRKANGRPPPPSSFARDVPADLEHLCLELLSPKPEARPNAQRIREMLGAPMPMGGPPSMPDLARPIFVGRDAELSALTRAYLATRSGRLVTVRVVGEPGVGKTALVRHFLDELAAEEPTLVRLTGRCYASELVPFRAWDGVIDALTRHLRRIEESVSAAHAAWLLPKDVHALTRVFPVLSRASSVAELLPPREAQESPEKLRRRAFDALRELFKNLARESPIAIFIDDFHAADRDSLLLFEDLVTHAESPPLFLVVTERPDVAARVRVPATRIELGPLETTEARALAIALSERAERPISFGTSSGVYTLAEESGGHPMFLTQLVHHAAAVEAEPGKRLDLRLENVVRSRVSALGPEARRVLDLVCVTGLPVSVETLELAARLPRARLVEEIDGLCRDLLLRSRAAERSVEPYHDRIRDAVVERLTDDEVRGYHAALASALSRASDGRDHAADVVRHLAAAGQDAKAAEAAEIAARRAHEATAFDRAAELYRLAISLGRHGADKERALRLALSDALASAGRGALEAAQGFLAAADAERDADRALELRTRALEQLAMSGHVQQALELLRKLCRSRGVKLPETRAGAVLSLLWSRMRLWWRGLPERVELLRDEVSPSSSAVQQLYMTAFMNLPILDPALATELHSRTLLHALDGGDRVTLGLCLCREAGIVNTFNANAHARSERASTLAHQLFDDSTDVDQRGWLLLGDGLRYYFQGQYQTALSYLRGAEQAWSEDTRHYAVRLSQIAIFVMGAQRYLGRIAELRVERERHRRDAEWRGNRYLLTTTTIAYDLAILLTEGRDAARRELEQIDMASPLAHWGANAWYLLRREAETALFVGAPASELMAFVPRLERMMRTQFGYVVMWRAEMRWLLGRVLLGAADRGDPSGLSRVRALARWLSRRPMPYAGSWGALLAAALATQRGDMSTASTLLSDVAVRSELNGYALTAACARMQLVELGLASEGGEAQRSARSYFAGEGIVDVAGTLRAFTPGFTRPRGLFPRTPLPLPRG